MRLHRRQAAGIEDPVDHLPDRQGLALGKEVGLAGDHRTDLEPVGGLQVRRGGVVDIDGIDQAFARADAAQGAPGSPFENARHQVVVFRPPDQVRPQGDRRQRVIVGLQNQLLGFGLGLRVEGFEVFRVGHRFIDAFHVGAIKNHARRAGMHQPPDAVLAAGGDDILGAEHVGPVELVVRAPDARLGGDVKNDVAALDSTQDRFRIS